MCRGKETGTGVSMLIAASDDGKNRRPAAALMFGPDARAATGGSGLAPEIHFQLRDRFEQRRRVRHRLLVETLRGRELLVLVKTAGGYGVFVRCPYAYRVTSGALLKRTQPEKNKTRRREPTKPRRVHQADRAGRI